VVLLQIQLHHPPSSSEAMSLAEAKYLGQTRFKMNKGNANHLSMDFDKIWYIRSHQESGTLLIFKVIGQRSMSPDQIFIT
jgi:hypothetical protein